MSPINPRGFLYRWYGGLRLRQKLSGMALLVAATAAIVASTILLVHRLRALRQDQLADTVALTKILAENLNGVAAFEDQTAANTMLKTLHSKPLVRGAAVDLAEKINFATFGQPIPRERHTVDLNRARFDGWILQTFEPISDGTVTLGVLYLETDLHPAFYSTLRASALALALALALAVATGIILSLLVRGFILTPVDYLHSSVRRVASRSDHSIRAEVLHPDEIGELTTAFNQMLEALQQSDAALRKTNLDLENTLRERAELENRLVETSRLAGMAQVATGVLHNVGNVLNSVNISAQIIRENLATSQPLALLDRVGELLRSQGQNTAHFLAHDERGQRVPALVSEVASQIAELRTTLQREADLLAQNIDHVKQIVSMQQSYAVSGGLVQRAVPAELFAEAQQLASGSILRHEIQIERAFGDAPEISTDRHQVLQVLVNFVTNAVQAVKAGRRPGDRRIEVGLRRQGDSVIFTVRDNGIGIPPENLQKIFSHGFTTRKDGHGFGLHSGALTAKKLGGQVYVESEGSGRGALFTLELPINPTRS